MQDAKSATNLPSVHHRTTLSGHIFATKAHIDNWKKNLLNSNISVAVRNGGSSFSEPSCPTVECATVTTLSHPVMANSLCRAIIRWPENANKHRGHEVIALVINKCDSMPVFVECVCVLSPQF